MSNKNYKSLERCSKQITKPGNKPEMETVKATLQNKPEDRITYDDPAEIHSQLATHKTKHKNANSNQN